MMVVDCKCGNEVEFMLQQKTKSPIERSCGGCDRVYRLTVSVVKDHD